MRFTQVLTATLLAFAPALAIPGSFVKRDGNLLASRFPESAPARLLARQSCAETCGNVCYFQSTIDRAVDEGYELYLAGETEGSNDYPHTFNNREGFDFAVSGPYLEFPIMDDFQEYDGGSPGADRVVFNTQGVLAGVITHTGAGGNNFLECDG